MKTTQVSKNHWRVRLLETLGDEAKTKCGLFWKSNLALFMIAIMFGLAGLFSYAMGVWTVYMFGDHETLKSAEAATNLITLVVVGVISLVVYVAGCMLCCHWIVNSDKKYFKVVWNVIVFPFLWLGKTKEKAKAAFMNKFCKKIEYID